MQANQICWSVARRHFKTNRIGLASLEFQKHADPMLLERLKGVRRITRVARVCPLCLKEGDFWRASWEILFYDTCHVHAVALVDRCHICLKRVSWARKELCRCDCGADYFEYPAVRAPVAAVELSRAISEKLSTGHPTSSEKMVDRLTISQIQRLVHCLGAYGSFSGNSQPQKISNLDCLEVSWQVTSIASEIFYHWPESFHRFLDGFRSPESSADEIGRISDPFGHLYRHIFREFAEVAFSDVRAAFETYLHTHWQGQLACRNRWLSADTVRSCQWIPLKQAVAQIGARSRLNRLIDTRQIQHRVHVGPRGRKFISIHRQELAEQCRAEGVPVDLKTAANLLGLSRRRARGVLPLLWPEKAKWLGSGKQWEIQREAIESVLAAQSPHLLNSLQRDQISMFALMKYCAWTDQQIVALVRAVTAKKTLPIGQAVWAAGVAGFVFCWKQLEGFKSPSLKVEGLTVQQAAEKLQIKDQVAYFWVRTGFLPSTATIREGRQTTCVSAKAIDDFSRSFVLSSAVAKTLGTSSRALAENLARHDIQPASGPHVDGCRQLLFRKTAEFERAFRKIYGDRCWQC